ncbi:hypothetical protein FCM35_KLT15979 [Carex littledalei]|uniref:Uncharacterized protein n=1 Tax=Carex littledalei TaxID=544730 RepID=A0A833RSV7_9POAL|nr:hypothetical protein FCM35_KLT15979 [Carex littledalei]
MNDSQYCFSLTTFRFNLSLSLAPQVQKIQLVTINIGVVYSSSEKKGGKEETKTAVQAQSSATEKGDGSVIGSAGIISVLTIFLTVRAMYPATANEAIQPPAVIEKLTNSLQGHHDLVYRDLAI